MRWSVLALASSAFALGGCQNALVGEWRTEDQVQCVGGLGDIEFTIDDNNLEGDGEVCNVSFDVDAEDKGDKEYELDFKANDGSFDSPNTDCEIDDKELDCDFGTLLGRVTFEKRD